jgi:hypothetical protein
MLCEGTTPELPETLNITCPLNRRPLAHARASPMTLMHAHYRGPTCTLKLQRFSARREASNFRFYALWTWADRPDQLGSSQLRQPEGPDSRPAFLLSRAGRVMGKCPGRGKGRACRASNKRTVGKFTGPGLGGRPPGPRPVRAAGHGHELAPARSACESEARENPNEKSMPAVPWALASTQPLQPGALGGYDPGHSPTSESRRPPR